jgi:hypothetical protein
MPKVQIGMRVCAHVCVCMCLRACVCVCVCVCACVQAPSSNVHATILSNCPDWNFNTGMPSVATRDLSGHCLKDGVTYIQPVCRIPSQMLRSSLHEQRMMLCAHK